jgi:hypothetical protein
LHYKVTTGGYRILINTYNGRYHARNIYEGITVENDMIFRFDYDVPVHCTEDGSCTSESAPLQLEEDITKVIVYF